MTQAQGKRTRSNAPWLVLIALGIIVRIAVVALPDNHLRVPWSGGGDAPVYSLLAHNIVEGKGLTYALQPTAGAIGVRMGIGQGVVSVASREAVGKLSQT